MPWAGASQRDICFFGPDLHCPVGLLLSFLGPQPWSCRQDLDTMELTEIRPSTSTVAGSNDEQPRSHGKSSHPPPASKERQSFLQEFWKKLVCHKGNISGRDARSQSIDTLKSELRMDEHLITKDELFNRLEIDHNTGITEAEAADRLKKNGPNALTPPKKTPELVKYFKCFFDGFGPLMMAGAFASLTCYCIQAGVGDAPYDNLYVFIVLMFILTLSATFSYWQTARSEKIMESFTKMVPTFAKVLRGGVWKKVPAESLVVGDLVEIKGGDRVPADMRVLTCQGLKVDNSSLTGEMEPQPRGTDGTEDPMESKNLMYYTTYAVEGAGEAIVIKTGDNTFMGQIAKLTAHVENQQTPIGREIGRCVMIITCIALIMGAVYVAWAFGVGVAWLDVVTLSIGLMAGNMPGGLTIMVTTMLSLTAKRLAAKNCLIKNLEAVETLGSCSIICSDKTGTLTQNRMTISHVWVDDCFFENDTAGHPDTTSEFVNQSASMRELFRVGSLCLRATFHLNQDDIAINLRTVEGDASESAILKFLTIVEGDVRVWRQKNPPLVEMPFNSTTKFQVSVHELEASGRYLVTMKGAPEVILSRCSTVLYNGQEVPLGASWEDKFNNAYSELGHLGERVLGFCDFLLPTDQFPPGFQFDTENVNFPLKGLRFVGLMSMLDPPRATVPDAVSKCRSAGIRVIMVTGDHPVTAAAIARSVGIISAGSYTEQELELRKLDNPDSQSLNNAYPTAAVIHGTDLRDMSQEELIVILKGYPEIVFARTSPQQKLLIVEACQKMGAIVAVTGDGVNDAPALRKADIGVAMGITGSDVSTAAADLVLMDDNFASIINGVEEGRLIFDNIKKTCCYAMTTDIPEAAPVILYLVLNLPLGLYTISMILLNCATDLMPAVSLAYEPPENDLMKLPPRKRSERLINSTLVQAVYAQIGIIESVGAFLVYFVIYGENGFWPDSLLGRRIEWEDTSTSDLLDSYGQEWTYHQRKHLEHVVQSGFFISVVIQNIIHLLCRRCRRVSVFQKGTENYFAFFAFAFELGLACFCVYTPYVQIALGFSNLWFPWVFAVLPFCLYIFVYDELRRLIIRKFPGSWADRNLYV